MTEKRKTLPVGELGEKQVLEYLRAHPEFLRKHPDIVAAQIPPERALGDAVVDFQHFQVKSLQKNAKSLQSQYDSLIDFCRDNLSAQSQVHSAVLKLIGARSLEQLLEAITMDLVSLFDLDVVRLALESDIAEHESHYHEQNYSGIVFISPGIIQAALGAKPALLVADSAKTHVPGFDDIFVDCTRLIRSYALLKLKLEKNKHQVLLAFGVRHADRFHAKQAIDLLVFLAQIIAIQLDHVLDDIAL